MKPMLLFACALAGLAACASPGRPAASSPSMPRSRIMLTYLGAAGWQMGDGKTTVLVDPYFSRPDLDPSSKVVPDDKAIAARTPGRAALVLTSHSHVDHVLDVAEVARRTGAEIVGTESVTNYARAAGTPREKLVTVQGGEDYEFDGLSVRVIPSLHSAVDGKHTFAARRVIPADIKLPVTWPELVEGGTLAYLVRLGGHQVLVLASANFIERELEGLRPDVVVVATGIRDEIHDFSCRLMRVLGQPKVVFASHFDDWTKAPAPPSKEAREDLGHFEDEIHACAPRAQVIVPEHFRQNPID